MTTSLTDDALRLAELDRRVVRNLVEGDTEDLASALESYMTLRQSLRVRLLEWPVATVENIDAAAVLRKVSGGEGLPTDGIIERLLRHSGEAEPKMEFDEQELWELGDQHFYSWYSHHDYVTGLAELRPLIHRSAVPESVSRLVRQMRNSYAFQQYEAAYALCRTAIEVCIRDVCVRRNLFPDVGEGIVLFEKYHWGKLRDTASSGALRERLTEHYRELSAVLHGRKTATRESALHAFKETLEIIEDLYRVHEL